MVIICDEAHNLIAPPKTDPEPKREGFKMCGERIKKAKNTTVVLFTATPVGDIQENKTMKLLDITMGPRKKWEKVDGAFRETKEPLDDPTNKEGYISWYMTRAKGLFASFNNLTGEKDDSVLRYVPLKSANYCDYVDRRFGMKKWRAWLNKRDGSKLADKASAPISITHYENMDTQLVTNQVKFLPTTSWKEDKGCKGDKNKTLFEDVGAQRFDDHANKLMKIVNDVATLHPKKTVIFLSPGGGFGALELMFRKHPNKLRVLQLRKNMEGAERADVMSKFNHPNNTDGSKYHVLLVDEKEFSEGVSFMAVRDVILADLSSKKTTVPTWTGIQQRIARCLRLCSHQNLPAGQRKLNLRIYVSTLDDDQMQTYDERHLDVLLSEREKFIDAMSNLWDLAIDKYMYYGKDDEEYKKKYHFSRDSNAQWFGENFPTTSSRSTSRRSTSRRPTSTSSRSTSRRSTSRRPTSRRPTSRRPTSTASRIFGSSRTPTPPYSLGPTPTTRTKTKTPRSHSPGSRSPAYADSTRSPTMSHSPGSRSPAYADSTRSPTMSHSPGSRSPAYGEFPPARRVDDENKDEDEDKDEDKDKDENPCDDDEAEV